jgi:hypothetical protein
MTMRDKDAREALSLGEGRAVLATAPPADKVDAVAVATYVPN